ncbi:MAG: 2OG-Fe(II) oxygenase [Pseudomonadota bacterium]
MTAAVAAIDWPRVEAELDTAGAAVLGPLLDIETCRRLASSYDDDSAFRSHVIMARHGFGQGEYKYFDHPLPVPLPGLREALYGRLAPIANRWNEALGVAARFPSDHAAFLERCHAAGQRRPTPLLLRYRVGDHNCLHQDVYGEHVFPLQVVILLSSPGDEFTGGELVLTEQRPRMQSRAEVLTPTQGEGVVFPVRHRPVHGRKGVYRVNVRHGVSRLRWGERFTTGLIFHDAA